MRDSDSGLRARAIAYLDAYRDESGGYVYCDGVGDGGWRLISGQVLTEVGRRIVEAERLAREASRPLRQGCRKGDDMNKDKTKTAQWAAPSREDW